jgi:hypothetical protein
VRVLSQALQSADHAPVLLVCEPPVRVPAIVGRAAHELPDEHTLYCADLAALRRDAPEPGAFADRVAQLLADAAGDKGRALFFDATDQTAEDVPPLLAALQASPEDGPCLVVAVGVDAYVAVEAGDAWEGVFRVIWLHALTEADLPREL